MIELSPAQKEAIALFTKAGGGLCWHKVGEGKTRIAIMWCLVQALSSRGYYLIICRRTSFYDWREEIKRCAPEANVYEDTAPICPPGYNQNFWLVSDGMLANLQLDKHNVHCVVLDEGWMYANHRSQRSKAAQQLTTTLPSLLLSGSIMKANSVEEIWSQAAAINAHTLIARNFSSFVTEFMGCHTTYGFPQKFTRPGAKAQILTRLAHCAHIHFPDGRPTYNQFHNIPATDEQREHFSTLRKLYYADLETGEMELSNAMAVSVKAQQIANGWVNDKKGNFLSVRSNKPEKLQAELESLLQAGERTVVWCAFRYDVEMLAELLPFKTVVFVGGQQFDHNRWRRDDCRVCLATEASGTAVNHFRNCSTAIYYSATVKWKDMQQSRGRTDRKDSTHNSCFYKYLQVDDSFDGAVYQTALDSGDAEQSLINLSKKLASWLKR